MLISSSAIIIRKLDNKVFIARRSLDKEFSAGKWETIGGRGEEGELPEECLKREVKEELNVGLKTFKPFKDYSYDKRVFKTFIVELDEEPNPHKTDFEDWGWFSKEEIEKMDFAINCKERIIDYYNQDV